jgi:hypothetical protein
MGCNRNQQRCLALSLNEIVEGSDKGVLLFIEWRVPGISQNDEARAEVGAGQIVQGRALNSLPI